MKKMLSLQPHHENIVFKNMTQIREVITLTSRTRWMEVNEWHQVMHRKTEKQITECYGEVPP